MTKWTGRRTAGAEHHVQVDPRVAPGGDGLVPLLSIPDGQLSADAAYQLVHDEAMLDGNSRLNLATFVGTWMEPQALKIYTETVDKNMIDKDEYPQTAAIEERCVRIVPHVGPRTPVRSPLWAVVGPWFACCSARFAPFQGRSRSGYPAPSARSRRRW